MITVATRAEGVDSAASSQPADCLAAQRALAEAALELMRALPSRNDQLTDLLRVGASCMQLASDQAFTARNERDAIRAWSECEPGERQIRSATYHALCRGLIRSRDYDALFRIAARATRARRDETERLRRRLRQLAVI
jgi:hypothetical protein